MSAIIRRNIAALRETDYRIRDTGDGALIAFVTDPEHALYMALAIAQDFGKAAVVAGFRNRRGTLPARTNPGSRRGGSHEANSNARSN